MHHIPEYLENNDLRLIIFGGKGGVGKTTMATAAAVHLARSRGSDKKILIISTDPAHSLSDSFGIRIGDRVTPIPMGNQPPVADLFAHEMDATRLLREFKEKNEAVIKRLADRGTYFDRKDIADFYELSLPGMDEVMAVIEIANLLREGYFDILVLDTAPTGHTVRMLDLPEQMRRWIDVVDLMQHKHRYLATHFTGKKYIKDDCDAFLDNLSSDISRVDRLLSDRKTTRFVPVMIPEPMVINETKKLIRSLEKMNMPAEEIVVNRIVAGQDGSCTAEGVPQQEADPGGPGQDSNGCEFCAAKRENQKDSLTEIEDCFGQYKLLKVPVFPNEIREVERLKELADYLSGTFRPSRPSSNILTDEAPRAHLVFNAEPEFIFLGGKGGVGKTSLASAVGMRLAQQNPGKTYLVFSTDPAHSLSDSFKLSIGDKITPIPYNTNLFALEINAAEMFEDFKQKFKDDIQEMFDRFLKSNMDIKFDREVMTELFTLAPPGLDEIMALNTIMDLRESGDFDAFVLDTSPTGHLLRFLELPELVREWLGAFFRLLLKYRGVVRLTKAAETALAMSKNVRRIQEAMVDPERTTFVAVTIAEAMGVFELERLINTLEKAGLPCANIAVNMVVPPTDCAFCAFKRIEQTKYIKKIHSRFSTFTVTEVPLFSHEVRGPDDLRRIGEIIFSNAT